MTSGQRWGTVEAEPEVETWFLSLPMSQARIVARHIERLETRGTLLDEPYTRQLHGKLRELRLRLGGDSVRISYFIASGRRIILLTVFSKQARQERMEIDRAFRAMEACVAAGHTAEDER